MRSENNGKIVALLKEALENGVREELKKAGIYPGKKREFEEFKKNQLEMLESVKANTVIDIKTGMILAIHLNQVLEKIEKEFSDEF